MTYFATEATTEFKINNTYTAQHSTAQHSTAQHSNTARPQHVHSSFNTYGHVFVFLFFVFFSFFSYFRAGRHGVPNIQIIQGNRITREGRRYQVVDILGHFCNITKLGVLLGLHCLLDPVLPATPDGTARVVHASNPCKRIEGPLRPSD